MASNMTLKLAGVDGESVIDGHTSEIDILSHSFGVSNASSIQTGTGGGVSKCNVSDLSVMKLTDKASTGLFLGACSGQHYDTATLYLMKAGGDSPVVYLQYDMEDVFITSWQISDSANSNTVATESVSMAFSKVTITYTPQGDSGSGEGATPITWDVAANKQA